MNIQERRNKDGKITSYRVRVFDHRDVDTGKQVFKNLSVKYDSTKSENWNRKNAEKQAAIFEKGVEEQTVTDSRITFAESTEPLYYFIGSTGNFDFENENRTVLTVGVKKAAEAYKEYDPIEYSRIVTYTYIGIGTSRFDAVFDLDTRIPVAETFVGPKNNLLEPYDLSPTEEIYNGGISYLASESTMV